MPDLIHGVVARYSFVKYPTVEELLRNEMKFSIGKFKDIQIQELSIYGDGVIISSACDTDILVDFLNDIFSWCRDAFGIDTMLGVKPETYFESTIIVRADVDLANAVAPKADIGATINRAFSHASSIEGAFASTGFIFDIDARTFAGRRKPIQFMVERRLGVPFEENVFYCRAPLPTKAHLGALRTVEDIALR